MDTLTQIQNLLAQNWELIGFAFTALGLSALMQKFKNRISKNPKVLVAITSTLAFATTAIPALLGWLSANPEVLGKYTAFTFMLMTLLYRYVVQPASSFISDVKDYKAAQKAQPRDLIVDGQLTFRGPTEPVPEPAPVVQATAPIPKEFDI